MSADPTGAIEKNHYINPCAAPPNIPKRISLLQPSQNLCLGASALLESSDKTISAFAHMQRKESTTSVKQSPTSCKDGSFSSDTSSDSLLGNFFSATLVKRPELLQAADSLKIWRPDIGPTVSWLKEKFPEDSLISIRIIAYISTNYFHYILPNKGMLAHVLYLNLKEENLLDDFFLLLRRILDFSIHDQKTDRIKTRRLLETGLILLTHPEMQPFLMNEAIAQSANYLLAQGAQIQNETFGNLLAQARYAMQTKINWLDASNQSTRQGLKAINAWISPKNEEEESLLLYLPTKQNNQIDPELKTEQFFLQCIHQFVCRKASADRLKNDQEILLLKSGLQVIIDPKTQPLFLVVEIQKIAEKIIRKAKNESSATIHILAQIAARTIASPQISLKSLEFLNLYLQEEPFKIPEILTLIAASRMLDPSGDLFTFTIKQIHLLHEKEVIEKKGQYEEVIKRLVTFAYYWKQCSLNIELASNLKHIKSWNSLLPTLEKYPQAAIPQEFRYISRLPSSSNSAFSTGKTVNPLFVFRGIHPVWDEPSRIQKLHDSFILYLLESWEMVRIENVLSRKVPFQEHIKAHAVRCNQLTTFIGTQILFCDTYSQAQTILRTLNQIQKKLVASGIYEVAFILHSALELGPISRLCKVFAKQKEFSFLFQIKNSPFNLKDNSKILREMQESHPHVFEVSMIAAKDISANKENLPDYQKDSTLNIHKFKQLGEIYHRVAIWKDHFSHFYRSKLTKMDDFIFLALQSQSVDSEEFLHEKHWTRSEKIHPPQSKLYWDFEEFS
jgi:hypothetical protein